MEQPLINIEEEPKSLTEDVIVIEKTVKPKRKPKSPVEKVECSKCGLSVRKYDLKRHETMYCNPVELEQKTTPKARAKATPKPPAIPVVTQPNNMPDNNELLMQLLQQINQQPKNNKQERYKNMMSQVYKI